MSRKRWFINFLLHDSGRHSKDEFISVLPIVGDSGVGKTTLVQHACNDFRVRRHFPTIIFFSFSSCSNRNGWRTIQHSKHINGSVIIDVSNPLEFIRDNFSNKKLLMVIEDVDMHKSRMLELLLQNQLGCAKPGNKMIVTTNSQRAASVGTVEPLRLKFLPYPEHWFFFKAHAFAGRDVEEVQRLVVAGKAISRKINRSFFGAKIIGGLLRDHPDPKFWCKVLRSNIGGLSLVGDGVNYVADLAENLWLNRVNLDLVTISKNPVDGQAELAKFKDLCELLHGSVATHLAQDVRSVRVLMCKSVLPFYSQCYIASCTVGSGDNNCPDCMYAL